MNSIVSAVVLAAGSSQRMGSPKALLKIGEETFFQHIVEVLHSARIIDVVAVLGFEAEKITKHLGQFDGRIVLNEHWQKGQLSSITAGLDALDSQNIQAAMICPVDHPLISQSLIVDLLQAFWKSQKRIVVPTYKSRRGHPVIIERSLFNDLRTAPPEEGARSVIHRYPGDVVEVPTEEKGVVTNIDTPEDYELNILIRIV
ncbi:MAG: nucleotidyltransferase family protein [Bacteroidota bacterium]